MLDTDPTPSVGSDVEPVAVNGEDGAEWSPPDAAPSWWERQEPWSLSALALALIGLVPLTWQLPIISLLAVVFALVGLRRHQLEPSRPHRWFAVVALCLGLATLAVVVVGTSMKRIDFLPFWTQP
jgi:hypothetical protein